MLISSRFSGIFAHIILVTIVAGFTVGFDAYAQGTNSPDEIVVGIRVTTPVLGSYIGGNTSEEKNDLTNYGGFCSTFVKELKDQINVQDIATRVQVVPIENDYKGRGYPRFNGLLTDSSELKLDLECGANSRSATKIFNRDIDQYYGEKIAFSNKFYDIAIKILIKKELAQAFDGLNESQRNDKLKSLTIAVVRDTTTASQLRTASNFYTGLNFYPNLNEPEKDSRYDIRDKALDALQRGEVDAFASDDLILQTIVKDGVVGDGEYRETRAAFTDYVVFPKNEKLHLTEPEEYGIAVRKNSDFPSDNLLDLVNRTLSRPGISEAIKRLEQYNPREMSLGTSNNWWLQNADKLWIPIIVALIGACATVAVPYLQSRTQRKQPSHTKTYKVTGRITDRSTGEAIANAKIMLIVGNQEPLSTFADTNGVFSVSFGPEDNSARILVDAEGYQKFEKGVAPERSDFQYIKLDRS